MVERRRRKSGSERFSYSYKKRSAEQVKKSATTSRLDMIDPIFKPEFTVFKAKEGVNWGRILPVPNTAKESDELGLILYIHYGVGPDNLSYLCLERHKKKPCPLCEERKAATRSGDEEYVKQLNWTKRMLVWWIDRNGDELKPVLFPMPYSKVWLNINSLTYDRQLDEPIWIEHPTEGFDVEFTREGTDQRTQYSGVKIARRESPISKDRKGMQSILEFVEENPLDTVLNFFSFKHIAEAFSAKVQEESLDEEYEEDEPPFDEDEYEEDEYEEDEYEAPKKRHRRRVKRD